MNNYQVPEEYRNFVSNAKEVLEQFQYIGESDRLVFRVFDIDNNARSETTYKEALERCFELLEKVESFLDGRMRKQRYLWFREIPRLRLVFTTDSELHQPASVFVEGSLRVGDCVDDEWFLVKELLALSNELPSIGASIVDSDGQFLLIEAADCIPEWLNPESADNRIWLRRGSIDIIPLNAQGRLPNDGIPLDDALRCLTNESRIQGQQNDAFQALQSCIRMRTGKLSPAYLKACEHQCVCYLPSEVARMIHDVDGVLGTIVDELGKPKLSSSIKSDQAREGQPKQTKMNFWKLILPRGQRDRNGNRCAVIVFTRAQFAKMIFKPFRAPAVLQEFQKNAFVSLMKSCNENPAMKKKAQKSVEVSCRLLVGVALLLKKYYEDGELLPKGSPESSTMEPFLRAILGALSSKSRYLLTNGKLRERQTIIEAMTVDGCYSADAEEMMMAKRRGQSDSSVGGTREHEDSYQEEIRRKVAEFFQKASPDTFSAQEEVSLSATGDDSWLTLSEEAFDREMRLRTEKFKNGDDAAAEVKSTTASEKPDNRDSFHGNQQNDETTRLRDMDNIISGMKGLMEESSDSEEEGSDGTGAEISRDGLGEDIDTPLHVDMNKVFSIVNKYKDGEGGGDYMGTGDFSLEEYNEAMEEELFGTAMAETFERTVPSKGDPAGAVDMEKNLLKNLMEAEAIHPGASSPAAALLALIGAKLPGADEDARDMHSDEDEDI